MARAGGLTSTLRRIVDWAEGGGETSFAVLPARTWRRPLSALLPRTTPRRRLSLLLACLALLGGVVTLLQLGNAPVGRTTPAEVALVADQSGNGKAMEGAGGPGPSTAVHLTPATSAPAPTPASVADAPPLESHEVFGFAPYWTLDQSSGFDYAGLTTVAYFSIGVNPDGSLAESGPGWEGYQSQQFVDLIDQAHQAGDRVVLTVNCFDQGALDELTSSPSAPATLSAALISTIEAKDLDGVNIDFEGEGDGDQQGLTNLITQVSSALHRVDPHWQVTMDTYASSAGDPDGFYDIPALAPAVDGFFVMAYELNLQASAGPVSPLTSSMYSNRLTAAQYAAAVPPGKVILGMPFFGYQWPTTDGTLDAQATGGATTVTYGQMAASGDPVYWDSVTDTAWTSTDQGGQWYESFFEDPTSLYLVAQLAQSYGLGGVGIWALGMDGNDPAMVAALDGNAPAVKDSDPGPSSTPPSVSGGGPSASGGSSPSGAGGGTVPSGVTRSARDRADRDTADADPTATGDDRKVDDPTTTSTPAATTTTITPPDYQSSGVWEGSSVTLTPIRARTAPSGPPAGVLEDFSTDDPALSCLGAAPLDVWRDGAHGLVAIATTPSSCATASFSFAAPSGSSVTTTTEPTTTDPTTTEPTTTDPTTTTTATTTSSVTSAGGTAGADAAATSTTLAGDASGGAGGDGG